jgi:multidrug efflux pump subunit AcrA (membrane-fusion protein)
MNHLRLPLIAAALLALAAVSIARTRPVREPAVPLAPPPVSPFERAIGGVGLVEPSSENIALGTPVAGLVSEVLVRVGQDVARDEPLFRIESRREGADLVVQRGALEVALANVAALRAQLLDLRDQERKAERLASLDAASRDLLDRRRFAVQVGAARLAQAESELRVARAQLRATEVEIERRTVRAPIGGRVLQLKVRAGEFAPAGPVPDPLLVLGDVTPLHVRVDVDERDAARLVPGARAVALERGDAERRSWLEFVRIEPFVVPKRSLSGDAMERVDTRVLQAIYRLVDPPATLLVGQQVDVFIEERAVEHAS